MKIELEMSQADFEHIAEPAKPDPLRRSAETYDASRSAADPEPERHWEYAYWVGVNWANVMLARAFVLAKGHECEIVWDTSDASALSWRLLTSYGDRSSAPTRTREPYSRLRPLFGLGRLLSRLGVVGFAPPKHWRRLRARAAGRR